MILLYKKKNIVEKFHDPIHIFKNYFITVFLIFSFNNNKFNLNGTNSLYRIWVQIFHSHLKKIKKK